MTKSLSESLSNGDEFQPLFADGRINVAVDSLRLFVASFGLDAEEAFLEAVIRTTAEDISFMSDALDVSSSSAEDVSRALRRMSDRLLISLEIDQRRRECGAPVSSVRRRRDSSIDEAPQSRKAQKG
ncbi:MAG: hypothetical protein QM784_00585 [Polyangiaceae bacterium]